MDIIFNYLFKIDIEGNQITQLPMPDGQTDLKNYIVTLLDKILVDPDKKGFEFQSETAEIRTLIGNILAVQDQNQHEYAIHSTAVAERLLRKEIESQQKTNLKVALLKGIVVVSFVKFDNGSQKIIISKADYDEFLDALTYVNRTGFPLKKRIYKAFLAEIDDQNTVNKVAVFDTNSTFTVYWWRDFLELQEIYTDEYNTENVFDTIEMKVLDPLKKKFKADHVSLWNATVHYFRVKPEFTMEGYISDILTGYKPFNDDLDMLELGIKAKKALETGKFDSKFAIVTKIISKRFKKSIPLTPQIDLNLKSDIQNLKSTIKRFQEPNGDKWVMIKSPEGYEYFSDTDVMP
ncbi:nucleoid-associated protein [Pedobacter sp. ISL-68]|uniref:nucleoid-associated protein n=1 Tax=unclassified Pedobacter TaxID=2628915 RepID=UPI001BE7C668|nr:MULTISPECIES: nucleoid-associated protein [unclassified Pedobacter]MBT2560844.1 nucleoid-associated protein [Pedobacter sp. ISL-64]MBT2590223.1 nucleoid-associated protein [Pedobacter sp. ISL-68]